MNIMIKQMTFLMLLTLMIACSSDDDSTETFVINGQFNHTIPDCDNTNNPEMNCVEFIEFIDETSASLLIGGGDIVYTANYEIEDDKIDVEIMDGRNSSISFLIQDEMTLRRTESDEIWTKVE